MKSYGSLHEPRNIGVLEDADAVGTYGSPVCGDMMEISLKVENNVIVDAKFRTFGCGSAIRFFQCSDGNDQG